MIPFEVNTENAHPLPIMRKWRQIYKVKMNPQTTGSIEENVQPVHIHSDQIIDIVVYNEGKRQ